MAESNSDRTLMRLLASDLDEAERTADAAMATERLPNVDTRTEMLLRAMYGPHVEPTAAQRFAARTRILDAMAADLAEETAAPGPQQSKVYSAARRSAEMTARASAGWADIRSKVAESLLKLFAPAGEVFAMRAVRMAAVPLLALLVVGSIWTGMLIDRGDLGSTGAGNSPGAVTPTTRGLAAPAERDLKRDIAAAEAARGPAHPEVASKMAELAALYRAQGRYSDAEGLYTRALTIQRNALRAEHPDVIRTMRELAEVYRAEGRLNEADDLLRRANAR
jgi:tetratricopeptide (TPR) repeat protein